jgi:hypothetical protein
MVQAFSAAARAFNRVEAGSESARYGKGIPRR